jgi:monofunctional glycosyltransferase
VSTNEGNPELEPTGPVTEPRPKGWFKRAKSSEGQGTAQGRPRRRVPLWRRLVVFLFLLSIVFPAGLVLAFRFFDPPFTWLMAKRAIEGETIRRTPVSIDDISPNLVRAVIAAEDARYCSHSGFDFEAIEGAMAYNERQRERHGKKARVRGASTISQQTAKNVFLWPDRTFVRKGLEVYFTLWIEVAWPKRRIMEAYLNAAEWGDGVFGAEAAAQANFNKSAKNLTPREAARLAAVLPSPNRWSADTPGPMVRRRTGTIQGRAGAVRREGLAGCVLDP